ncbi:putative F420-0 ABC transporter substrate-binding protein [Glaciibacter flavus]|uniref:Putative F420-0 ABC transporter substrate-binding protein n=1 Tax=Orlajensenia flava TaxID=2565934 RepID=A0A4S4FU34_9MICO|nr:putative F420-0 ABC transporter substrate-binding protein [Glaciibacter flavus]THG33848.1 putative F420-0 ABC transporter substrate-binding protein [Glaciibacter flavus]
MTRRRLLTAMLGLTLAAASVIALAGCALSGATASAPSTNATAASGYPLTIDNCGTKVTFTEAPQRVVTIKSTTLETMLALGLQSRIVGTAFTDGPVAPQWKGAAAKLTSLSDQVPGQEATLTAEPDLVYAGWESNVTAEGAGDRPTLASLGVNTYVAPSACKEDGYKPDPLTFDDVFSEIDQAGAIFGVPDRAAALVTKQKAQLKAITPNASHLSALWYSSGTDTPYVGAGIGAPEMMMKAAGLTNVAAGVKDTWSALGWESIVADDPDVIVLVDATWNTAASKIANLEANPATAGMTAVKEKHYVTIPFPAGEAGVRNVEAVASITTQLAKLGL